MGLSLDSTSLANRTGNATTQGPCLEGAVDMLLKIDDDYARKFAHVVGQLDSFEEAELG